MWQAPFADQQRGSGLARLGGRAARQPLQASPAGVALAPPRTGLVMQASSPAVASCWIYQE